MVFESAAVEESRARGDGAALIHVVRSCGPTQGGSIPDRSRQGAAVRLVPGRTFTKEEMGPLL